MLRFKSDCIVNGFAARLTKFCCFLYEWDSRDKNNHYIKKEWPKRESLTPGWKHVLHTSLVKSDMMILSSLHIKLGFLKSLLRHWIKMVLGFIIRKKNFLV